jgi:hypothetical protein
MKTKQEKLHNKEQNQTTMENLIKNLKSEDKKYYMIGKAVKIMYYVLILIYCFEFIFDPFDDHILIDKIGGMFALGSFIGFIIYFDYYTKKLSSIDYSLPTIQMLRNAAERYSLWGNKSGYAIIPVLLLDIAMVLLFWKEFGTMLPLFRVLIVQAGFLPLIGLGVLIGYLVWKSNHKPLREKALKLIEEIES